MSPIFVFLREVRIRTQGELPHAGASRRATNLATHLPLTYICWMIWPMATPTGALRPRTTMYMTRVRVGVPPAIISVPATQRGIKGTGSPDKFGFSWHLWIWIDLGLKKGRGWFSNFSIIHWNTRISYGKCDCELAYKVSCLFLSVPANHRPSILSNDKSGLASCWCLTKGVCTPPANPPSQWETRAGGWKNLSNHAGPIGCKESYRTTKNGGAPEIINQDSLAGCWCTADLGKLNIGQLQVPARLPPAKHLTLTNKEPLWTNKALASSSSSFIVVKIYSAFG